MEDINDIFKQMNRDLAQTVSKNATKASDTTQVNPALDPRVVTQKESVLYIKNPKADWAFNKVLSFQTD